MASDPQTWAELKASVATWLNRDDLTAKIPEFIALAERQFNRTIFTPDREASGTLSTTSASVALPADFWGLRSIYLDTDPRVELTQVSPAMLNDSYSSSGQPAVFAIQGGNITFGPTPDATYSAKYQYYAKIPALGASQATNWLLTDHPDIYLYGTLLMAEAFVWNDARLPLWKAAMDEAVAELTQAGNRKRYSAQPLRLRSPVSY